ncbi:hypothetical protein QFC19_003030 [Naganishia cerealis]|uniref:Uncharacterized protein n=1 Tax=Naganishia cerealis TaxID=610337 RepID=A0ACC2W4S0_9TREE|nr:hypothetical protein QFC19_003030 [Naganishia cerealis]
MFWKSSSTKSSKVGFGMDQTRRNGKVVTAHFMVSRCCTVSPNRIRYSPASTVQLGNTYPYTEADWEENFKLAEETGIDAFALNLGPEQWQSDQARTAYRLSSARQVKDGGDDGEGLKLFLSLDMNVLPSSDREDMFRIVDLVEEFGGMTGQFKVTLPHATHLIWSHADNQEAKKIVLSTFGGGDTSFGGVGWQGFLVECKRRNLDIFFMPSFFLPPEKILGMPYVDATFDWNSGWPMENHTISVASDAVFIRNERPYMAAVSPWFFTHYGTEGQWAWNKNWIYRSDDNLYISRWKQILDKNFDPKFVQVISWNDYGESHYIGPIMGAQPGSDSWTKHHDHDGWRPLTKYLVERYKGLPRSTPDVGEPATVGYARNLTSFVRSSQELQVWLTYRTHPKALVIPTDPIGRPDHADWAQDVISVAVLLPETKKIKSISIDIKAGDEHRFARKTDLAPVADLQTFIVPFGPGDISFEIKQGRETLLEGKGAKIEDRASHLKTYNFNAWSGYWNVKVVKEGI